MSGGALVRSGWHRLLLTGALIGALLLVTGCGGGGSSESSTVSEGALRAARKAGEIAAHERDRVNGLQRQVRILRHQVRHGSPTDAHSSGAGTVSSSPSEASGASEEATREFHVASGNVSCQVRADGASCTVEPIQETFAFSGGEAAWTEPAAELPVDLGELVPYGSTVVVGTVSCEVPPSDVARGVTCADSASGHGFEASRVAARQKAY